jgi:transposase
MPSRPSGARAAVLAAGRAGYSKAPATRAATPRPKQAHGSGRGKQRWVVERIIAWLHQYRRLCVRYDLAPTYRGVTL